MTKIEIPVKGMHCPGCERTLEVALTRVDGVRQAHADRAAERVTVHYDPDQLDEQALRERIALCGYEAA